MAKPTAQQCHALTTHFVSAIEGATGKKPVVNRNKARWGMESVLMDHTPTEAKALVDYYVSKYSNPTIDWFLFNYEKVVVARDEAAVEAEKQRARREATQERLESWRNRWKK